MPWVLGHQPKLHNDPGFTFGFTAKHRNPTAMNLTSKSDKKKKKKKPAYDVDMVQLRGVD